MSGIERLHQVVGFGTSEGDSLRAPEGRSFFVVTTDEAAALKVAPMLAEVLEPGTRFGRVLHHEEIVAEQVRGFEVVLEVKS